MRTPRRAVLVLYAAFFAIAATATAFADAYNKLTYFTFSAPVELPGVALPAGTYAFKLADVIADRNVLQVFNKDQTKIYATILAIPDYRPDPSDKTIIRFSETAPGAPPAVKEWFYPGDNWGLEFVYPKSRAVELAKAANTAVPSMPEEAKANITTPAASVKAPSVMALEKAPLKAEEPSGEEVQITEAFQTTPAPGGGSSNTQHRVNTEVASRKEAKLPKTSSMLPLMVMAGLLLLVTGAMLWIAADTRILKGRR